MAVQKGSLEVFERHRPRLLGLCYRMLGSMDDAEDLVQEAYLRWHRADVRELRSPEAWLVSVTTRLAIDRLRRAAAERKSYPGNWLPEPVAADFGASPERAAEQGSDLSVAFMVLLERLGPEERAAFLLREVFDAEYGEIAEALEKSEPAVRQIVHRARTRVREGRTRFTAPPQVKERMLDRFLAAIRADDKDAVLALLAEGAVVMGDGGGKVAASPRPIHGAEQVAQLFITLQRKMPGLTHRVVRLNGEPAVVSEQGGRILGAMSIETDGERIVACYNVLNPDKLRRVREGGTAPSLRSG